MDVLDQVAPPDAPQVAGNGYDYNTLFAQATKDEAETKISGQVVDSHSYYVVHFTGAKGRFTRNGLPDVRASLQIKEGIGGFEGAFVSDSIGAPFEGSPLIAPNPMRDDEGVQVKKDLATLKKQIDAVNRVLIKIARVGKFVRTAPLNFYDVASLQAYADQFKAGFDAVVEIGVDAARDGYPAKNRIKWDSLRAFDDPAMTKEFKGKTALEEAKAKIAARLQADKTKGAAKSGTAATTSRQSPEQLFQQ